MGMTIHPMGFSEGFLKITSKSLWHMLSTQLRFSRQKQSTRLIWGLSRINRLLLIRMQRKCWKTLPWPLRLAWLVASTEGRSQFLRVLVWRGPWKWWVHLISDTRGREVWVPGQIPSLTGVGTWRKSSLNHLEPVSLLSQESLVTGNLSKCWLALWLPCLPSSKVKWS